MNLFYFIAYSFYSVNFKQLNSYRFFCGGISEVQFGPPKVYGMLLPF